MHKFLLCLSTCWDTIPSKLKFADTKEVIRSHKSKDWQYNGKKIINTKKTNNCLKKSSCTKPSKNPDETQVLGARKGKYFQLYWLHQSCYLYQKSNKSYSVISCERKNILRCKIDTLRKYIYITTCLLSWLGTDNSIKGGIVKLFFRSQIHLCEIIRSCVFYMLTFLIWDWQFNKRWQS